MDIETRRYPLDFDALKKGDVIPAEQLESITSEKRGTEDYRFKVLKLCERIKAELAERNYPVTLTQRGQGIHILTDEEASPHNEMLIRQDVGKVMRHFRQLVAVNPVALTDEQRTDHEQRILTMGRYVAAIKSAKREIPLEPTESTVPGRLPQKG